MMISPYVYTIELLKDASIDEILTTIHNFRQEIKKGKKDLEASKLFILVTPGPHDHIFFKERCVEEAIKLLKDQGYTCEPTQEELEEAAFEERLRHLSSIAFQVKIEDRLHHIYKLEVEEDVLRYSVNKTPEQQDVFHFIEEKPKTEHFSFCLQRLYFTLWRSHYIDEEDRYFYIDGKPFEKPSFKELYRLPFTLDFFQWSITLAFEDNSPPCHYQGKNAVSYHLDDFMGGIFALSWEKLEKLSE